MKRKSQYIRTHAFYKRFDALRSMHELSGHADSSFCPCHIAAEMRSLRLIFEQDFAKYLEAQNDKK